MIGLLFCGRQLVVTAKQLQGNPVLFWKSLGHEHDLDALKVVVVAAHDDLDTIRTTHAGVDLLKEGERETLFHRNTDSTPQRSVLDGSTC